MLPGVSGRPRPDLDCVLDGYSTPCHQQLCGILFVHGAPNRDSLPAANSVNLPFEGRAHKKHRGKSVRPNEVQAWEDW
jgi:hypothetical protein